MTESQSLDKCLHDRQLEKRLAVLELRQGKTRRRLIDFMTIVESFAVAAAVDNTFRPASGFYTFAVIVLVSYPIVGRLNRWLMRDD